LARASFNRTMGVYGGPDTADPLGFKRFIQCRFVPYEKIQPRPDSWVQLLGYITTEDPDIVTAEVYFGVYSSLMYFGVADVLQDVLTGDFYCVNFSEVVTPFDGVPYQRHWLTTLPS